MIMTLKLLAFMALLQSAAFAIFYYALKPGSRRLLGKFDLVLLLSIPVVGLVGSSKLVFYGYVFLLPILSANKPDQLARRYLLFLPMFPALDENLILGGIYAGSFSAIQAFNLGALTALALTSRGRARSVAAADGAAWLFFFMSFMMTARGVELNGTLRLIGTTLLAVIPPYYILARLIRTRENATGAMIFFALGAFSNATVALFEFKRSWPLYQSFYDKLHVSLAGLSATLSIRAGMLRAQGPIGNPASLGLLLALAMLIVLALRGRFQTTGRWFIIATLTGGVLAGQSRGAWVAAAVGVGLYFLYERRGAVLLVAAATLGIIVAALQFTAGNGRLGEFVGRSGHGELTVKYRSNLLTRGLQEIAAHPLTGQTRTQLEVTMNDLRGSERIIDFVNTHLYAALTTGIGGFLLWMTAWITPLWLGWSVRGRRAAHSADAPVGVPFAMLGACFTCLTFTSTIDRMLSLVMLSAGLMAAFVRLSRTAEPAAGAGQAARPPALVARRPEAPATQQLTA